MIKLNRIRNIFTLTILLSPLFGFCAEELARERENNSSEWDTMHVINLQKYGPMDVGRGKEIWRAHHDYKEKRQILKRGKDSFVLGVSYCSGKLGDEALKLIFEKLSKLIFNDPDKNVDFEQEVKKYFRDVGNKISDEYVAVQQRLDEYVAVQQRLINLDEDFVTEVFYPRVSVLLFDKRDRDNFYVASVGARVMIIRNGKIIFGTKRDHREFSNPEVFKHHIEAEDIVLGLTKAFEQLSDEHIIKTLSENEFRPGSLLGDTENFGRSEAILARFSCGSSFGSNEVKTTNYRVEFEWSKND